MLAVDVFSEVLNGVKLTGALYFNAEYSAPWGVATPAASELAPVLAPGAGHVILYHFILEGAAFAHLGGQVIPLGPGDIVIFPHGDPHVLSSEATATAFLEPDEARRKLMDHEFTLLRAGGGGALTRIVCGYMACDAHLGRPVLSGLPPVFKVNVRADNAGRWLENSILHLVQETASGDAGHQAMLAKLSEALFVDTLRRYVATLPPSQSGWLAGARDEVVGKSLALLHSRADFNWTIAGLAAQVGVSRSTLVERFTKYLGEPPMAYLTRWRLQLAARSLAATSKGVAQIAVEVGYESEAAFNRAFKREFTVPPGRYRSQHKSPR